MSQAHGTTSQRRGVAAAGTVLRVALGALLLLAIVVLPNDWGRVIARPDPSLPLEWVAALGLLLVLPRRAAGIACALVVAAAGALLFIKLADMGTGVAFARPFNPILDLHLFVSGWHLLSGSVGVGQAVLAIGLALLVFFAALLALGWGLRGLEKWPSASRRAPGFALLLLAAIGAVLVHRGPAPFANTQATRFAVERADILQRGFRDLAEFETLLDDDPARALSGSGLLQRLEGKDVLFLFVESYGRSAVEGERYADAVRDRLAGIEAGIGDAGFAARSGWLTAPTVGGQSWLAHAALLSGLWVDKQQRYERLMVSERPSLNRIFKEAGWRTVGVMPAITMDWPEARWYGYDTTYVRDNLGYRGDPFNWVTMPDQFTLKAMQRFELDAGNRAPVMAEVSLISSHAPWTPIPPLLPWNAIGDGTVFNPHANSGDPPDVVWRDHERVRDQYALSIDYALETIGSYIETFGTDDLVLVVLGDHQPASIVTGPGASWDVPVHLIAADPDVLEAIDDWNWTPGLIPDADAPVMGMDKFRERFLRAFSEPALG